MSVEEKLPVKYMPKKLKGYVSRVKMHLGKENLNGNVDTEVIRRFEKTYGINIIGIIRNNAGLGIQVYNPNKESINTDVITLVDYYSSTTVQRLGAHICDLVVERSKEAGYKKIITPDMTKEAMYIKADLNKRIYQ